MADREEDKPQTVVVRHELRFDSARHSPIPPGWTQEGRTGTPDEVHDHRPPGLDLLAARQLPQADEQGVGR